jgi:hypothetical protein
MQKEQLVGTETQGVAHLGLQTRRTFQVYVHALIEKSHASDHAHDKTNHEGAVARTQVLQSL